VGEFHATFAHDSATRLGYDYVMLGARGEGKVVGVSFTEDGPLNRFLTHFMEGDERIYIDRSSSTFAVHRPAAAHACWTCAISAGWGVHPRPG